ncbi:MAG: Fic family protein [Cyanobacteria bacterium P01_D01_bin.36]
MMIGMATPYSQYDPSLLEPMRPKRNRKLEDLAVELAVAASQLTSGLHPVVVTSLSELVRSMNCYYSNLIEGHRTTPRDIEKALNQELSSDSMQRDLQLEAKAHIEVQRLIDSNAEWLAYSAVSPELVSLIHSAFYERLPSKFWQIESVALVPGQFRTTNVQIGNHIPPYAASIPAFLARFAKAYDPQNLSKLDQIIAAAAAHHRFLWIHPFLDGNGRVVRLMSHAYLQQIGVGSGLWSISRGLARQVTTYRQLLSVADGQRQNDYDGRGNLSMKGLIDFCEFFLETCLDQVNFMSQLLEPSQILKRMEAYTLVEISTGQLLPGSFPILKAAFLEGQLRRGDAATLSGYRPRQARSVLTQLMTSGLLCSSSPKGPVRLAFPVAAAEQWFPRLWADSGS